jgi:hypothetical protein
MIHGVLRRLLFLRRDWMRERVGEGWRERGGREWFGWEDEVWWARGSRVLPSWWERLE